MRTRLQHLAALERGRRRAFEAALAEAGVEVTDGDDAAFPLPVVVVFDRVTAKVLAAIAAARDERRRALLVGADGAVLLADDPWTLLDAGASDVLPWMGDAGPAADIAARLARWARVDDVLSSRIVRDNLVGDSTAWIDALREVIEVATFTDAAVLVTGESGTGKELVARLIHTLDARASKGSMIVVDCTTVVPTLSGSEFFGHERGAFTGAISARDGAFARADGGTLFLDEVGELPTTLQAELLRVIQEGTFKRVGSDVWRTTRFRLVSATNRPLDDAMASGAFRPDLYHRIAAWTCELPPLRDRRQDIPELVRHFLAELRSDGRPIELDPAVVRHLASRDYPGNVRELRLLVARIAARHVGDGAVTVGDLPEAERPTAGAIDAWWRPEFEAAVAQATARGVRLVEIGRMARQLAVAHALDAEGNDTGRAARRLGVSDRAVQARRAAQR